MKILFIGLSPSSEMQKALLSNLIETEFCKKISEVPNEYSPDFIQIYLTKESQLEDIKKHASILKNAWVQFVIPTDKLLQNEFYSKVLQFEFKNDVVLEEHWQNLFWFSIQKSIHHQSLLVENETHKLKLGKLEENSSAVSKDTQKLIERFERDLQLAESIQRSLLPRFSPVISGVSISAKYIPASGMGGDYYDIFEFGDKKRFGVLLADSKTHGMAATLLSILLKLKIEEVKDRFPDSSSLVAFLNSEIEKIHAENISQLSLLFGIFDRSSLTFQYTSAGNLKPLLWRNQKPIKLLNQNNPFLGSMNTVAFKENTIHLEPGDFLLLHSDGLSAPFHATGNLSEKLTSLIGKKELEPLAFQNEIMGVIDKFKEKKKLPDDLTLIHLAVDKKAMYLAKES